MFSDERMKKIMKDVGKLRQDNYPDLLGEYYVINAPWWFRGFFAMAKYMIDKDTRKKIHIYGSDWQEELKKVVGEERLPKEYGGTVEVDWADYKASDGPWLGYCEWCFEKKTFFPLGEEYGDPSYAVKNFRFTEEQLKTFDNRTHTVKKSEVTEFTKPEVEEL